MASPDTKQAEICGSRTNSRRSATFLERVWPQMTYVSRSASRDFPDFGQVWPRPPLAPTRISTFWVVSRRSLRDFGVSGSTPIGLRFSVFGKTRRGLTDRLKGFDLKKPMCRNSFPALFRIFARYPLDPCPMPSTFISYSFH